MVTCFLGGQEGCASVDFIEYGSTITSERYCKPLQQLRAIQNKHQGKLSSKVLFLHDNAQPHMANHTRQLLEAFKWEVFDHPPYSPYLVPSDYHLFAVMMWVATQSFDNDVELQAGVINWFKCQVTKYYNNGIQKLVHCYDKCLNLYGDYVEK